MPRLPSSDEEKDSPLSLTKGKKQMANGNFGEELEDLPFSVGDLKKAIPAHCFERSNLTSFCYLFGDLFGVALLFSIGTFFHSLDMPLWAQLIFWPVQWVLQGVLFTGLWVIAHECGHRGFSASDFINDTVGLIVHSALLVPYHSWRLSHGKHHQFTNNMDEDQVFVPPTRSEVVKAQGQAKPKHQKAQHKHEDTTEITSLGVFWLSFYLVRMFLVGWPAYLILNVRGKTYKESKNFVNHFNPYSPIFSPKERHLIILSDAALVAWIGFLGVMTSIYGFEAFVKFYLVPYLMVNFWLVFITYLQHTDTTIPHYSTKAWTWLKGALCTVDRNYGVLNIFFHHIGDTHVLHHIFSKVPHYHAQEATKYIIPILGKHYRIEKENVFLSMWKQFQSCVYVEDAGDVLYYKTN